MSRGSGGEWRELLGVALLGFLFFFPGLGNHSLWNPDEPRYAEVAREMAVRGDYLVPHYNGEVYTQKPPLLFWAISLSAALRGRLDETATRLPVAWGALGTLLLTFAMARRVFGRRAAWIATAVLATCYKVPLQARIAQIDMLLTFLVTLGVYFWLRGYVEKRQSFYPLFFLAAGFATLAKGPVGLLPPLLSIVAFLLLSRDRVELRRLRIGRGLLLWAVVVLAWLVPAGWRAGETYLQEIVFRQNVTRYANPWHHHQPFWYYLPVVLADLFPWSFLLPSALVTGWRRLEEPERRRFIFCLCWVVVTVLFFSLSPAKRTVYVLTMFPGLAMVMGAGLDRLVEGLPRERGWLLWPLGGLAVASALVAAVLPVIGPKRPEAAAFSPQLPGILGLTVGVLALAAGVGLVLAWRGQGRQALTALAVGSAVFLAVVHLNIMPRFDVLKSARPLARELLDRMGPDEVYGIYPRLDPTFIFYTERYAEDLGSEEELQAFARRPERVWVLAQRDELAKLKQPLPLIEVARDTDPEEGYFLLTQPEASGATTSEPPAGAEPITR